MRLVPGYSKVDMPGVGAVWHRWIRRAGTMRTVCNRKDEPGRRPSEFVARPVGKVCRSCRGAVAFLERHGQLPSAATVAALVQREAVEAT